MVPTPESGSRADLNGSFIQMLVARINPGLRLSTKQNSHFDGRINDKIVEIKACEKKIKGRAGRFTLKKKQHDYLVSASADYIFSVHDNFELVFYLRVPASQVPYESECKQKTITWHMLPKLISGS